MAPVLPQCFFFFHLVLRCPLLLTSVVSQLGAAGLAELLNKQLPTLPDEQQTTRIAAASVDAGSRPNNADAADGTGLWDDEDTRAFYETLPDLKLLVPAVLLGGAGGDAKEEDETGADDKVLIP